MQYITAIPPAAARRNPGAAGDGLGYFLYFSYQYVL